MKTVKPFTEITSEGKLHYNFHEGQLKAWNSKKRIVAVIAGNQSGKSVLGPPWMWNEMKQRGPGDYIVVSPTYPLMDKKTLPAFLWFFKQTLRLGEYSGASRRFTLSPEGAARTFGFGPTENTQVFFGHASDPDSLESATGKAAWLDEAGQNMFKLGSWEAIQRRMAINQGRILISTTPYNLGWLKQKIHDPWRKAGGKHAYIDVINFDSRMNPAFPREEYERARRALPAWKFNLFYRGIFTRPAGLIYDSFNEEIHKIPRFAIPPEWDRFLGLDFGGVNTAATFWAREPETERYYHYREYKTGGRTAREHVAALLEGEPMIPFTVGGSKSEGQWRDEFRAAGLPVREPTMTEKTAGGGINNASVEVGIDRVYGGFKRNELFVFDDLEGFLDEVLTYSREVGDDGEPTEKIEDKEMFHRLDSVRYIMSVLKPMQISYKVPEQPSPDRRPMGPGRVREERLGDSPRRGWPGQR